MFLSIHTEFRIDWKRKIVSEWHILTLPSMMPLPKAIIDNRFVYNPTRYFSWVNFIQTLSKYLFEPIRIVKDLLRERRIFKI